MAANAELAPIIVKKKKAGDHGHHGGAWKIAYADFVTAMMAFFLLMWLINATSPDQLTGIANYFTPSNARPSGHGAGGILGGTSIMSEGMLRASGTPAEIVLSLPDSSDDNFGGPANGTFSGTSAEEMIENMVEDGVYIVEHPEMLAELVEQTSYQEVMNALEAEGIDIMSHPEALERVFEFAAQGIENPSDSEGDRPPGDLTEGDNGLAYYGEQIEGLLRPGTEDYGDGAPGALLDGNLAQGTMTNGDLSAGQADNGDAAGNPADADVAQGDAAEGDLARGEAEIGDLAMGEAEIGDMAMGEAEIGALARGEAPEGSEYPGQMPMGELLAGMDDEVVQELAGMDDNALQELAGLTDADFAEMLALREAAQFDQVAEDVRAAIDSIPELNEFADNLIIEETPEGLRIQIVDGEDQAMFPSGSADMAENSRNLMANIALALAEIPNEIMITGHTDARPFANDNGYGNWELSTDRANASRRALIAAGIDEDRITRVVGRADREPMLLEDPYDPINRRISIVVLRAAVDEDGNPIEGDLSDANVNGVIPISTGQ